MRDERARLDAGYRLADVPFEVRKGFHGEMRLDTRLLLDLLLQLVVGKGEHPAIRVVDQDDLARAEQALGDGEGSDLVVRYDADGVRSEERRVGKECRSRWSPYH